MGPPLPGEKGGPSVTRAGARPVRSLDTNLVAVSDNVGCDQYNPKFKVVGAP